MTNSWTKKMDGHSVEGHHVTGLRAGAPGSL